MLPNIEDFDKVVRQEQLDRNIEGFAKLYEDLMTDFRKIVTEGV